MRFKNLLLILSILGLIWCWYAIDSLDTNLNNLKNTVTIIAVKHNKLVDVLERIIG